MSLWLQCLAKGAHKVSICGWKLQSLNQVIPSNTGNFPLTANLTAELLCPCDRYFSVRNNYTLPQPFSHAPRLKNAVGENSPKEKVEAKAGIKQRN